MAFAPQPRSQAFSEGTSPNPSQSAAVASAPPPSSFFTEMSGSYQKTLDRLKNPASTPDLTSSPQPFNHEQFGHSDVPAPAPVRQPKGPSATTIQSGRHNAAVASATKSALPYMGYA